MHCGAESLLSPSQLLDPPLLLAPYSGVTSGQLWGSLYITFPIETYCLSCAGNWLLCGHLLEFLGAPTVCQAVGMLCVSGPGFLCEHLLCAWL